MGILTGCLWDAMMFFLKKWWPVESNSALADAAREILLADARHFNIRSIHACLPCLFMKTLLRVPFLCSMTTTCFVVHVGREKKKALV